MTATESFRAARDLLLSLREDYEKARSEFRWPDLETFNFGLDWFDVLAVEQPETLALWIVHADGAEDRLSYADLSARSSQVAAWLQQVGVDRGDRVLLVLGNVAPLWEVMLAAIKLGAVVIPATTLLGPRDLADRIDRGEVRHVITSTADTVKFVDVPRAAGRASRSVDPSRDGCVTRTRSSCSRPSPPRSRQRPTRRCCSTSPAAQPLDRSWSSTRTRPIPSGTFRLPTGSACNQATYISMSRPRGGPNTPGATSSRPGSPAPPPSSPTRNASPRARCSTRWRGAA